MGGGFCHAVCVRMCIGRTAYFIEAGVNYFDRFVFLGVRSDDIPDSRLRPALYRENHYRTMVAAANASPGASLPLGARLIGGLFNPFCLK